MSMFRFFVVIFFTFVLNDLDAQCDDLKFSNDVIKLTKLSIDFMVDSDTFYVLVPSELISSSQNTVCYHTIGEKVIGYGTMAYFFNTTPNQRKFWYAFFDLKIKDKTISMTLAKQYHPAINVNADLIEKIKLKRK